MQKGDYYHDEKHFEIVGYDVKIVVVDVINTLIPFADGDEDRVGSQERLLKGVGRAQNARTSQTSMERTITNSDKGRPPPLLYWTSNCATAYWLLLDGHPKAARTHYHYPSTQNPKTGSCRPCPAVSCCFSLRLGVTHRMLRLETWALLQVPFLISNPLGLRLLKMIKTYTA